MLESKSQANKMSQVTMIIIIIITIINNNNNNNNLVLSGPWNLKFL